MNPSVPGFLFPYILFATFATLASLLFGLNRSLKIASWPTRQRRSTVWSAAALLAIFYIAALLPARSAFYSGGRIPTIPFGLLVPIVVGIALFLWWRPFRRVVEAVPQQWLIGIQFYRTLGVIFLILYAADKLPAEFAWPAGAGDVLVGLLAPLVALAHIRKGPRANSLLRAWNLFGIADLVVATTTGFLTSPSPLQMLALDNPNRLITQYPLVMIPVFLVPIAILLHLASLQKLRQSESIPSASVFTPRQASHAQSIREGDLTFSTANNSASGEIATDIHINKRKQSI